MNYELLAKQFWEQGYLLIEDFFEPNLMSSLNDLTLTHYGVDPAFYHNEEFLSKSATEVIPWFPQQEGVRAFDAIDNDERFKQLTSAILGEGWQDLYCMTMLSKPGTKGQAWHQDCAPEDASQFNLNRLIYTHDILEKNGGQVLIIPGSHKRGEITVGDVDERFEDQLEFSPTRGSLILLHGHTWHRVLPISQDSYRVSTNFRCMPAGVPDDITDVSVFRNIRYRFSTSSVIEDRTAKKLTNN